MKHINRPICSQRLPHIQGPTWGTLLAVVSLLVIGVLETPPASASSMYGDECGACHVSGITILSNATGVISVEPDTQFLLQVTASGQSLGNVLLVWPNVAENSHFAFTPTQVEDNGPNDMDQQRGRITAIFKITVPKADGDYSVRAYAVASGAGSSLDLAVRVGEGGVIDEDGNEGSLVSPQHIRELLGPWARVAFAVVVGLGSVQLLKTRRAHVRQRRMEEMVGIGVKAFYVTSIAIRVLLTMMLVGLVALLFL